MATRAAASAFLDTWNGGAGAGAAVGAALSPQAQLYRTRWAFYANTLFEDRLALDTAYQLAGLYRGTRALYNPVRRTCRLLARASYPGLVPAPDQEIPPGTPLALPLGRATAPALVAGLQQLWAWSNMAALKTRIPTQTGALGDTLVELVDDVARGTVYFDVRWPGEVAALVRDPQGNLKSYALEYLTRDAQGVPYRYRKEVDNASYRTYRDDKPYGYDGGPAVLDHGYGFVPARWFQHEDLGGARGEPVWAGSYNKILRAMALASHIHAYVHKMVDTPLLIGTDTTLTALSGATKRSETDPTLIIDEEGLLLLQSEKGATVAPLIGNLGLADALALLEHTIAEVEADQPILRVYDELRAMSQVTGPAAARLVGDAASLISDLQQHYDRGLISLMQMALAVGGTRFAQAAGGWAARTPAQVAFAPFDLTSYQRKQLNFAFLPRPLMPPTATEVQAERKAEYDTIAAGTANLPLEVVLVREGWQPDDLAAVAAAQAKADARAKALMSSDGGPDTVPPVALAPGADQGTVPPG